MPVSCVCSMLRFQGVFPLVSGSAKSVEQWKEAAHAPHIENPPRVSPAEVTVYKFLDQAEITQLSVGPLLDNGWQSEVSAGCAERWPWQWDPALQHIY